MQNILATNVMLITNKPLTVGMRNLVPASQTYLHIMNEILPVGPQLYPGDDAKF